MGDLIQAEHLFRRDPTPAESRSKFWTWGKEWIDDGINNLQAIVAEVGEATTEDALRRALLELRDELQTYPLEDDD